MIDVVVIVVVLLLAVPVALWARGASRRMAAAVIPPVVADGPVPMHLERPRLLHVDGPLTRQQAAALAWPRVDPAFVQQALEQAAATNAATYAAMTAAPAAGRHRRPDGALPPGTLGMTGIMGKLDAAAIAADARMRDAIAAETGTLPAVRA